MLTTRESDAVLDLCRAVDAASNDPSTQLRARSLAAKLDPVGPTIEDVIRSMNSPWRR